MSLRKRCSRDVPPLLGDGTPYGNNPLLYFDHRRACGHPPPSGSERPERTAPASSIQRKAAAVHPQPIKSGSVRVPLKEKWDAGGMGHMSSNGGRPVRFVFAPAEIQKLNVRVVHEPAPVPVMKNLTIVYEGAQQHVIATAMEHGRSREMFTDPYLCPSCGQDGAVSSFALLPGGDVECPACGATMRRA